MRRWTFLPALLVALAIVLASGNCNGTGSPAEPVPTASEVVRVFVGTYTRGVSRGIYRFEIDATSGAVVSGPSLAGTSENPSFLALHPWRGLLYAVNEVASFRGAKTGAVSAFAVDASDGSLTLLDQQPSEGQDPCHVIVDGSARHLVVANYTAGTVAVLPLADDGRVEPAATVRRYVGSGPSRARQEGPHPHQVLLDRTGKYLLCADLGTDRIHVEHFDGRTGGLEPNEPDGIALDPGSGPRHLAWHPSGEVLYELAEMGSTVSALRWDPSRGGLARFQTVSTLPEGFTGENTAAEIVVSPDGRFVYTSNRGDDSLAIFALEQSGTLLPAGRVSSGGRTPRSFAIDPSGRWLIVANQGSDSVVVFRLDLETGLPRIHGPPVAVPEPVAILFFPPLHGAAMEGIAKAWEVP